MHSELQILEEIPVEAEEAGQSFSKKNGHIVFCITISNQNLDKAQVCLLGVLA